MHDIYFTDALRPVYAARQRYILNHATPQNVKHGKVWYQEAFDISEAIGMRTQTPGIVVRRVLSKISPRNRWEATPEQAENLIRFGADAKIGTTDTLKALALKMIEDHNLHLFDYKQAPKTFCFTGNMDKPGEVQMVQVRFKGKTYVVPMVTCDRHTIASFGLPFNPNGDGPNGVITIPQYIYLSEIMADVSAEFGLLPQQGQAIGWLEWRQGLVPDWLSMEECFA